MQLLPYGSNINKYSKTLLAPLAMLNEKFIIFQMMKCIEMRMFPTLDSLDAADIAALNAATTSQLRC